MRKSVAGIVGFGRHALERVIGRGVGPTALLDALRNPLKSHAVKLDDLGRPSQRFVGRWAEVVVNPATKIVISVNPTSTRTRLRLLRELGLEN